MATSCRRIAGQRRDAQTGGIDYLDAAVQSVFHGEPHSARDAEVIEGVVAGIAEGRRGHRRARELTGILSRTYGRRGLANEGTRRRLLAHREHRRAPIWRATKRIYPGPLFVEHFKKGRAPAGHHRSRRRSGGSAKRLGRDQLLARNGSDNGVRALEDPKRRLPRRKTGADRSEPDK